MSGGVQGTGLTEQQLDALGLGALANPDLSPEFAELARRELQRMLDLAETHNLSVEEVAFAERIGEDLETYSMSKHAGNIDEWEAGRRKIEARREARAEAGRQLLVDAERERLNNGKQE